MTILRRDGAYTILGTGVTVTTTGTSASTAIPTTSANTLPRYVRVTATVESYIKLGTGAGTTATVNDVMVQPADAILLSRSACTHFAVIQGTAAGKVNVQALEDN